MPVLPCPLFWAHAVERDLRLIRRHSEPVNFEALRRLFAGHGVRYTEADNDEFASP